MCSTDILTILALFLNIFALLVVSYQTNLTRQALLTARQSIDSSRKARELEILPRANFIITIQTDLLRWKKDLQDTIVSLQEIANKRVPLGGKKERFEAFPGYF